MRSKPLIYLAGRMDHEKGKGKEWREELEPFLKKLGFDVLNPYEFEPKQLMGLRPGRLPKGIKHWVELRDSLDPNHQARFKRYMRRIIRFDLDLIKNDVDYVIVKWDEGCKTGAGTHAEVTIAWDLGKPVFCVEEAKMPYWAAGCCDEIFSSFKELREFLDEEFGEDAKEEIKGVSAEETKTGSSDPKISS